MTLNLQTLPLHTILAMRRTAQVHSRVSHHLRLALRKALLVYHFHRQLIRLFFFLLREHHLVQLLITKVFPHDKVVRRAHYARLLERIGAVRGVGYLAEFSLKGKLFVTLVAVVAAHVGLGYATVNKVIAFHVHQIFTVLLR